ncbi:MAG: HPr family phosphocarrier protein [Planctomycetaceae bacterium]|nr:HPr family phosphocarrier protein [Planctomycetaceae bacterium]
MESHNFTMSDLGSCREEVVVNLVNGLHLVPCSKIAQLARSYACEIRICKGELVVDAKAVFDLMTLRAEQGTLLAIEADGDGACEVVEKLVSLFERNFDVDRPVTA